MGAPAVALSTHSQPATATLRVLHVWHLFSLDAPTVAVCWLLLFAQTMHVPHAMPAALALGCAVWLVYVLDRLLDARHDPVPVWPQSPHVTLSRMYGGHARAFGIAAGVVCAITVFLLTLLPAALREGWLSLAIPLGLYAAAVHALRLQGRWKAVCVGIFFAVAVALPVVVHGGPRRPLLASALAFGALCRSNCAVLRAAPKRLRIVLTLTGVASLAPLWFTETRSVAVACFFALALLVLLVRQRTSICARLGWLAWRALVDAALVAPVLVVGAGGMFGR